MRRIDRAWIVFAATLGLCAGIAFMAIAAILVILGISLGVHCHLEDGSITWQSCAEWMGR